jgi:hypothetical protein
MEFYLLTVETHPGTLVQHTDSLPEDCPIKQDSGLEAHPGPVKAHPGAMEAHPGAMEAHPGTV